MATVGYDWLALFYLSALILALTDTESWLARAMRWEWLRALGRIAYGVYLLHMLVYGLCIHYLCRHRYTLGNFFDFSVTLAALVLTLIIASLSWKYFGEPVVKWGHHAHYLTASNATHSR